MPKAPPPKPKFNWRLWSRVAFWLGVFVCVAWGAKEVHGFLQTDPRFDLPCDIVEPSCAALQIVGTTYIHRDRIRNVFLHDFGKSVFDLPLAERRRRLLAIDWVHSATITRVWPNRLVVTIEERRPVAFAKLPVAGSNGHRLALIDAEGVLLGMPPRVRFHLPVLSGVDEDQSDQDRRLRVKAMQRLLDDLGPQATEVSEINAASIEDLTVIADVDGHGVELWLGNQKYRSRYQNFISHYGEILKNSEQASVFDLRLDDRILAR